MKTTDKTLIRRVVQYRAKGFTWPEVADLVQQPLAEVERLPWAFPKAWGSTFRKAQRLLFDDAMSEAVFSLRNTLRDGDIRLKVQASNALVRLWQTQHPVPRKIRHIKEEELDAAQQVLVDRAKALGKMSPERREHVEQKIEEDLLRKVLAPPPVPVVEVAVVPQVEPIEPVEVSPTPVEPPHGCDEPTIVPQPAQVLPRKSGQGPLPRLMPIFALLLLVFAGQHVQAANVMMRTAKGTFGAEPIACGLYNQRDEEQPARSIDHERDTQPMDGNASLGPVVGATASDVAPAPGIGLSRSANQCPRAADAG